MRPHPTRSRLPRTATGVPREGSCDPASPRRRPTTGCSICPSSCGFVSGKSRSAGTVVAWWCRATRQSGPGAGPPCWQQPRGLQGLDDLGGQGRKRRITEEERSRIIALVKTVPPRRLRWEPVGEPWAFDESGPPEWTLDSLAVAARAEGITAGRSQVRRILLAEGVRRRRTRPLTRSRDPDFFPQEQGSSASAPARPTVRR